MNNQWTDKKINRCAAEIFLLCFMAYAFSYIGRQNFSACLPAMISDGTLTKAYGGYVLTAYMLVYGSGQLLNGVLGTRIHPQYLIGIGLCGAGLMNVCMGFCSTPWVMMVVWSLNGLFHSMLWAPMLRVFTDHLPERKRYTAGVRISMSSPIGTICAYLIPAFLLKFFRWNIVFFVCGGLLLTAFVIWVLGNARLRAYIAMMDQACADRRQQQETVETADGHSAHHSLPTVIFASGLLLILLCLFCNGALRDAMTSWAPTFISNQFGLDESTAALISVMIPVVCVSGAFISTSVNKRWIHNEVYSCAIMFAVSALCILIIRLIGDKSALLCTFCLAVSISAMWGANTMFLTLLPYHFAGLGLTSAITGFLNCFVYFASAVFSSVYGIAAEHYGWDALILCWLAIAVLGGAFSILGGLVWRRKSRKLDEGHLFD